MAVRRLAYDSPEFWRRFAPVASPSALAKRFPPESGGMRRNGWLYAVTSAKAMADLRDLPWLVVRSGQHITIPDDAWPEPLYADEVGAPAEAAPVPGIQVKLLTEERIEADVRIRRLRAELKDVKAKYEEAHADSALENRLCDALDVRIPALAPVPAPTFTSRNPGRAESVVALLSDAHIGEVVDFEETGGLNHYDFDVFCRRWQYMVDGIGGIAFGKLTGYDFPELVVCALGDMVSGIIHDELVETSDGTLMDWLIDGSHVIAQGLRQLATEFPSVRVEWHFGNHGRVTQKPRFKRRFVNYDFLLGHMVSLELRDQANVAFTNHKSFWSLTDIQGRHLLNLHGDNIKGWGGLPAYGIHRAVANLSALLSSQRRTFDIVNLGHFHQTGLLERVDCDIMLNGSIVGGNEYSYGALFTGSKPRQVVYGMHPERGRTFQYAIDVSNGDTHESRFSR